MHKSRHIATLVLLVMLSALPAMLAQDSDEDIRLNPELGTVAANLDNNKKYSYIKYDENHIDLNGDNWNELAEKLQQSLQEGEFTIVHIGDSHIQADGNTGTTRRLFQNKYGDAGRGIIIPFRLAGTNEPLDYTITSDSKFVKATLMRRPWPTEMGFTGVSLHPEYQEFSFNIKVKSPVGYFRILCEGDLSVLKITSGGKDIDFEAEKDYEGVDVSMSSDLTEFKISMSGNDVNIYGFDLRNDTSGVLYHAIGNNGAAYSSYNSLPEFGKSLSSLHPDLIIISLGTNEAFGKFNDEAFTAQLATMVRRVRASLPEAKILLVTPSECQKSVYTTKRTGKGRNRRTRKIKSYQVNQNVVRVRNLILDYGKKNHIPVYDFYTVAGGEGASGKWLADKLLSTDRIHRTWEGYRVDGALMYDALVEQLEN